MALFCTILFCMLVLHALADFPLQGEYVALAKDRVKPLPATPWWYVLGIHSLIHAGAVFFVVQVAWLFTQGLSITPLWWLAACEFYFHFMTDDAKCRGKIGYLTDQGVHILCKIVWSACACVIISLAATS